MEMTYFLLGKIALDVGVTLLMLVWSLDHLDEDPCVCFSVAVVQYNPEMT